MINTYNDYSIDNLINFLENTGYYEILVQVKIHFGEDVAISLCKDLVKTNHCEIVINVYIKEKYNRNSNRSRATDISIEDILNYYYPVLSTNLGQKGFNELYKKYKELNN